MEQRLYELIALPIPSGDIDELIFADEDYQVSQR